MKIRNAQLLIGLGCTIVFLVLTLYRVPLGTVRAILVNVHPLYLATALLVYAVNLSLRAWRWRIILQTVAPVSYLTVARALVVGYGLNAIIPARLGELFRAEFCKKDFGLPRPWALTSIVIERLCDGLTVVACLGTGLLLSAASRRIPGSLTGVLATASLIFGGGVLVLVTLSGSSLSRAFTRFPRLAALTAMVEQGLRVLRTRRTAALAIATAIIYVPDALSLWFIVKAVGIGLGLADTLVLVGAASLSTLLPSGPAFLGTLQFAYALAIGFAGAPRELGIAAAILAQLILLLPLAVVAAGVLLHRSRGILFATPATGEAGSMPAGLQSVIGQTPPQIARSTV